MEEQKGCIRNRIGTKDQFKTTAQVQHGLDKLQEGFWRLSALLDIEVPMDTFDNILIRFLSKQMPTWKTDMSLSLKDGSQM